MVLSEKLESEASHAGIGDLSGDCPSGRLGAMLPAHRVWRVRQLKDIDMVEYAGHR